MKYRKGRYEKKYRKKYRKEYRKGVQEEGFPCCGTDVLVCHQNKKQRKDENRRKRKRKEEFKAISLRTERSLE